MADCECYAQQENARLRHELEGLRTAHDELIDHSARLVVELEARKHSLRNAYRELGRLRARPRK